MEYNLNDMATPKTLAVLQKLSAKIERLPEGSEDLIGLAFNLRELALSYPTLEKLWEKRCHYYRNLAETKEYITVIDRFHDLMRSLHGELDLTQLPRVLNDPNEKEFEIGQKLRKVNENLLNKNRWLKLEDCTPEKTGSLWSWQAVLRQYTDELQGFLLGVGVRRSKTKEVLPEVTYQKYMTDFRKLGSQLHSLMDVPWHRDHLQSFAIAYLFIERKDNWHDDLKLRYETIREAVIEVIAEFMKEFETNMNAEEAEPFRFEGTCTNSSFDKIWRDGESTNRKGLNEGKRKYIWMFLSTIYGIRTAKWSEMDSYVMERVRKWKGYEEREQEWDVTKKDIELLRDLIATISPFSERVAKSFVFEKGKTIALTKIGS